MDFELSENRNLLLMLRLLRHHVRGPEGFLLQEDWSSIGFFDAIQTIGWSLDLDNAQDPEVFQAYMEGFLEGVFEAGGGAPC